MFIQERKRVLCFGIMLVCSVFVGLSTNVSAEGSSPVADANGPYEAQECYSILLDGSHSYDPDNDSLTYRWLINGSWIDNYGNPLMDYLWQDDFSGDFSANHLRLFGSFYISRKSILQFPERWHIMQQIGLV